MQRIKESLTLLCLHTQSGSEHPLQVALESCSVPAFAPVCRAWTHGDYPRRIVKAFFSTYLFALPSLLESSHRLRRLPIKLRYTVIGEVNTHELDEVFERYDDDTGLIVLDDGLKPGSEVVFTRGVYAGQRGIFHERCGDDERVKVLFSMLGRSAVVEYPLRDIKPAPKADYVR